MKSFLVSSVQAGKRADKFLADKYPDLSRSALEKLFDEGLVFKNGSGVKASYHVKEHDRIKVDDSLLLSTGQRIELPVIYQDKNVIVINKPEGVLTHSKGALNREATVATFIEPMVGEGIPRNNRAGIVHRLDRATSGIIICALNKETLSLLQKQFSQRKTKKTYLALVTGVPKQSQAIIEVPIERNPKRPQTFRPGANGKSAVTEYKTLETFSKNGQPYSLLELSPKTGRTHQLRVHMAHIGNPIVGDSLYGKEPGEHLYLHAYRLELTLPGSERKVFTAPPPKYFNELKKS